MDQKISNVEMKSCTDVQRCINQIDKNLKFETDPDQHKPLRSVFMWIRDESRCAKQENIIVRRAALRKRIEEDYKEMEEALLRLGLGFITTQP